MSGKKKPLVIVIAIVAVAVLGGGGYFAFTKLQQQTEENEEKLETVGDTLIGDSYQTADEAVDDAELTPSLLEDLPPSKKVVKSLQRDNIKLSIEVIDLKDKILKLNQKIDELEEYKMTNERFAPMRIKDEMAEVEREVKSFLLESSDAQRFSTVQIEIMAAASANEYKEYINRYRLVVTQAQRVKVATDFLPGYAFCIGDGIELAANNAREFELIAIKFRGQSTLPLPTSLQQDLDAVMEPCKNSLRSRLDKELDKS